MCGGHLLRELFFVARTSGGVQPQVEPRPRHQGASGVEPSTRRPRCPVPQTCGLAPAWQVPRTPGVGREGALVTLLTVTVCP